MFTLEPQNIRFIVSFHSFYCECMQYTCTSLPPTGWACIHIQALTAHLHSPLGKYKRSFTSLSRKKKRRNLANVNCLRERKAAGGRMEGRKQVAIENILLFSLHSLSLSLSLSLFLPYFGLLSCPNETEVLLDRQTDWQTDWLTDWLTGRKRRRNKNWNVLRRVATRLTSQCI
jgi:hypothetical protein